MTGSWQRRAVVMAALIWWGLGTSFAQDALRISAADTSAVRVEPGSVGTRLIRVSNETEATVGSRLVANFPPGWTLLIPPPAFRLEPGQTTTQLISFQVPASTLAGSYSVGLGTEAPSGAGLSLAVLVQPVFDVTTEWMDVQEMVRAGEPISGSFTLVNTGNAPLVVRLEARSSLGYGVRLSQSEVSLAAGESREVSVSAGTRDDILSRQSHSLVVETSWEGGQEKTLSFITGILPAMQTQARSREGMLPLQISFSGTTEEGHRAGQIELSMPETVVGSRRVRGLIRVPDVRDASVFAASDEYFLTITSARSTVRLGDQVYRSTELLETGSLGFGAGIDINRKRISAGGFAQRSRKIFPEREQAGAFVHVRPHEALQFEANLLAKRSYEQGEAVSLAVEATPGESRMRAEYALGWFDSSDRRQGKALSISAGTGFGKSTVTADFESADAHFLGSIQNTKAGSGAFTLHLRDWVRVFGQARARKRFYDLADGLRAEQTAASAQSGITFTRSGSSRTYATVALIKQLSDNSISELRRDDTALQIRLGSSWRKVGFGSTLVRGQAGDGLTKDLGSYFSGSGTAFASRGAFSANLFGSYLNGPTFYNPVKQERIMLGGSINWDAGKQTRLSISLFKSKDLVARQQEFTLTDTRLVHRFAFGHELTLRARLAQTAADASIRDGTFGATYRIPLFVPAPGQGSRNQRVEGRVMDVETGQPLAGVVITLDSASAQTDGEGRFSFEIPFGSVGYLSVDRLSIGLERRPVGVMPLRVAAGEAGSGKGESIQVDISIVRSARIRTRVALESGASVDRTSVLAPDLGPNALAGIVVEAQKGDDRVRRLTGRTGEVTFSDLVPGDWKVFAVGRSLPEGYKTVPDTIRVDLGAGEDREVTLGVKSSVRSVKIVSSGSASLGVGVSAKPRAVAAVAQDADSGKPGAEDQTPKEDVGAALNEARVHIVAEGETLSSLARKYYGLTRYWIRIWQKNRDVISNPDQIFPGDRLVIPAQSPLDADEQKGLSDRQTP